MEPLQTKTQRFFSSIFVKMCLIGLLILVLLIPTVMIRSLISEREQLGMDTELEIQETWGKDQEISGPMLTIPYYSRVLKNNEEVRLLSYAQLLPEQLEISGQLVPEIRYRGIYKVVVYTARLQIRGQFTDILSQVEGMSLQEVQWDDCFINLGISDLRGIENKLIFQWENEQIEAEPGISTGNPLHYGIHMPVQLSADNDKKSIGLDLDLRGSGSFYLVPMGKTTTLSLKSEWPHPRFEGAFLPGKRTINEDGFKADWTILHYNRSFPPVLEEPGILHYGISIRDPSSASSRRVPEE